MGSSADDNWGLCGCGSRRKTFKQGVFSALGLTESKDWVQRSGVCSSITIEVSFLSMEFRGLSQMGNTYSRTIITEPYLKPSCQLSCLLGNTEQLIDTIGMRDITFFSILGGLDIEYLSEATSLEESNLSCALY